MPSCGQPVYPTGTVHGTTCARLSTGGAISTALRSAAGYNYSPVHSLLRRLSSYLSTGKITHFNLLSPRLSPVSTAPITTRTKERKEKR